MRSRWHHLPVLHTALDPEKKVSWLELFYDLIFVAAIIQLGDALSNEVTAAHDAVGPFARFAALMVPLWVAWTGFTFYANRFDVDDFVQRTLVFLKMFAVGAMAISAPEALEGRPRTFALAYAVAQGLIATMYLRAWREVPHAKAYSRYWGTVFALGGASWLVSVFVPPPWCYILWAFGVGAILFAPVSKQSRALSEQFPIDMEHLSERYGLLTIIVLGESFVKVLSYLTASGHGADAEYLIKGGLNLLVTCCVWWIYFDDVAGSRVRRQRGAWVIWLYGHIPLAIGATAVGVAVKKAITFDFGAVATAEYRWLLAFALSVTFFSVAVIDSVTERRQAELSDRARVNVRFASALLVLLLGQAGSAMTSSTFLALVGAICVAQVVFDMMMAPFEEAAHAPEAVTTAELARRRLRGEAVEATTRQRPGIDDVVRKGTPGELRRDLYFFFIEGPWTRLIMSLAFLYVITNVFFAALYLLEPGSISGAEKDSFADAFQFSVQTMSTIGYGAMSPATPYGDLIVTLEAAVGLLGVALATGLMFAKASRPRSSVLFSRNMVLTTRHGKRTLMLRAGNARGNDVVDATMTLFALIDEVSPEGHHMRRVCDLKLVRDRSPLFTMSWTVMHEIDADSPLADADWKHLGETVISFVVTLLGHDGTYGQTTHARHLYNPEDVRIDHRFVDVIHQLEDGRMLIDYGRFHDTIPDAEATAEEETASEPSPDEQGRRGLSAPGPATGH